MALLFSCEFCKISKNTFFTEYLCMTASDFICGVFFYFPLSKIFATKKVASYEKNWLVENWFNDLEFPQWLPNALIARSPIPIHKREIHSIKLYTKYWIARIQSCRHLTSRERNNTTFYLYTTIRPKVRVLFNLIFLFVHDHST